MRANSNHNSKFGRYDLDAENVMAISDIESGEIIEVSPLGAALDSSSRPGKTSPITRPRGR
jgi:hypothetical protein